MIDNDAKACYDRILPYLTVYMLRQLGMPFFVSRFMCTMLKEMEYSVKPNNGMSKCYWNKDKQVLGRPKWLNTSDTCSKILNNTCTGVSYEDLFREIQVSKVADYCVDDTATGVNLDAISKTTEKYFKSYSKFNGSGSSNLVGYDKTSDGKYCTVKKKGCDTKYENSAHH